MKILALGDAVSPAAVDYLRRELWSRRKALGCDFVIANGENASEGNGLTADDARAMLDAGADVVTGGNHSLRKKSLHNLMDDDDRVLRPANFPADTPGSGYCIVKNEGVRILVINLAGRIGLDFTDNPFDCADRILARCDGQYDISAVDFHAEATGEKLALGRYLDGRVNIFFGTHTHVTTADEQVLPRGTGYITDLGFTGVHDSVLGVRTDIIIKRLRTGLPDPFENAAGEVKAHGALFTLSDGGRCESVERIVF